MALGPVSQASRGRAARPRWPWPAARARYPIRTDNPGVAGRTGRRAGPRATARCVRRRSGTRVQGCAHRPRSSPARPMLTSWIRSAIRPDRRTPGAQGTSPAIRKAWIRGQQLPDSARGAADRAVPPRGERIRRALPRLHPARPEAPVAPGDLPATDRVPCPYATGAAGANEDLRPPVSLPDA